MSTAALPIAPYRPRETQALGVAHRDGWTLKVTGLTATTGLPGADEVEAAVALADHFATPETGPAIAFLILHAGSEALWAILGRWELDILYHRLFRAPLGTTDFRPVPPDGPTACVWELAVIDYERRAWVEHVLSRPGGPDYDGYLSAGLTVEPAGAEK
ncbi:MAG TPA: hypothetical protein VFT31_10595 [Kribbella sp.]|nr:hypothetical protein [Kribbella sp.]